MKAEFETLLRKLFEEQGINLYKDRQRFRAFLSDFAPHQKLEVNLILSSVEARIPDQIAESVRSVDGITIYRLAQMMVNEHGVSDENAQWIVELWVTVLGKLPTATLQQRTSSTNALKPHIKPLSIEENRSSSSIRQVAQKHVEHGEQLAKEGKWKEAIEAYHRARNINPEVVRTYDVEIADALFHYAEECRERSQFRLAAENYSLCIETDPTRTEAHLLRGQCYLILEQYDEAIDDFGQALRINLNDAAAYCGRGVARLKKGRQVDARKDFDNALKQDHHNVTALFYRATLLLEKDETDQAIKDLELVVQLVPDHREALLELALVNKDYDPSLAIKYYSRLLVVDQSNTQALCNRGMLYFSQENFHKAIEDFTNAIMIDPHLTQLYFQRGVAYQQLDKDEEAIADFELTLQFFPEHAAAHFERGDLAFRKNDLNTALEYATYAIDFDPKMAEAYFLRGRVRYEKGYYPKALNDYSYAIKLDPQLDDAFFWRAVLYEKQNDLDKALVDYEVVSQIDPGNIHALSRLYRIYRNRQDIDTSVSLLKRMLSLRPDSEKLRNESLSICRKYAQETALSATSYEKLLSLLEQLAEIDASLQPVVSNKLNEMYLFQAGVSLEGSNYDDAIDYYQKAANITLLPNDSKFHYSEALLNRGRIHISQGRFDEAIEDFLTYLGLVPEPTNEFFQELARVFIQRASNSLEKGNYDATIGDCDKAIMYDQSNSKGYFYRGQAYLALKHLDEALASFTHAIEQNPDYAPALRQRAEVLLKQNLLDQAAEDYAQALRLDPKLQTDPQLERLQEINDWAKAKRMLKSCEVFEGVVTDIRPYGNKLSAKFRNLITTVKGRDLVNPAHKKGDIINLIFTEVDMASRTLVASELGAFVQNLVMGEIYEGPINRIESWGIFVYLGGVVGLVHKTELASKRINTFTEFQQGQVVRVKVISKEPLLGRVGLSMKQIKPKE